MAAITTNESALMHELASQLISQIGSFFERISVSPSQPVSSFPPANSQNCLYVLYSASGFPLHAGVLLGSMGRRDEGRIAREIQNFGSAVASYRLVELGSEAIALHLERLIRELFSNALPLTAALPSGEDGATVAAEAAPRRRGRPAGTGARRGRPSRAEAGEAPRRRGRPRKEEAAESEAAPRRRGRPRKAEAAEGTETAPRRRGRPRKVEAEGTETAPRRRGRPRKVEAAEATETAPRRRGRPRKNAGAEATETAPRRRGRPRKNEGAEGAQAGE